MLRKSNPFPSTRLLMTFTFGSICGNGLSHCPLLLLLLSLNSVQCLASIWPFNFISLIWPHQHSLELKLKSSCPWCSNFSPHPLLLPSVSNNHLLLRTLQTPCKMIAHSKDTLVKLQFSPWWENPAYFSCEQELCSRIIFPKNYLQFILPTLTFVAHPLLTGKHHFSHLRLAVKRTCHLFSKNSGSSIWGHFMHSCWVSGSLTF